MTFKEMVLKFFRILIGLEGVPVDRRKPPRDLKEFNDAKKRLKKSSTTFAKEIDVFGDLVYSMKEQKRVRPRPSNKPPKTQPTPRKRKRNRP